MAYSSLRSTWHDGLRTAEAGMRARRAMGRMLTGIKRWLERSDAKPQNEIAFDNRENWIASSLEKLVQDPQCAKKPAYIWGVLQGSALGKVLGMSKVSVIEFGVAGGAGLLALERIAERVEAMVGIQIEIYGFDTGIGLPKPQDYRDCPNLWLDGQFPMDVQALTKRLRRAELKLGLVNETVPAFLQGKPAPVAFAAVDLDLYSSTRDALTLFEATHDRLLPRVVCYFDDIIGLTYSDYNGERLAMAEFNAGHAMQKISPLYGLRYFVPPRYRHSAWPELMYLAHIFDHPLYDHPDQVRKPMLMDIDGRIADFRLTRGSG
jgi:hypothetical protein